MCGICGVISGNFTQPEEEMFKKLLFFNVFRGKDSTGVMRVLKNKREVEIKKSLNPSSAAIYMKGDPISEILNEKGGVNALIGHCRAATKGEIKIENAHPFEFSNVAGVHNGTIHKKFKGTENYGTDSEALYSLINDVGIEEALNEVQGYETPAYALCWYDKRDGLIRFIHNSQRPINFGFAYAGSTLAFSSDIDTLRTAATFSRMKLSTENVLKEKADAFSLHKHQMLTVDPTNVKDFGFSELKVEEYTRVYAANSYTNYGTYGRGSHYEDLHNWSNNRKLSRKEKKALRSQRNFAFARGFENDALTYQELHEIFRSGCTMCGCNPATTSVMAEKVSWIDDNSFACVDCSKKHTELLAEWAKGGLSEENYTVDGKVLN